MNRRRTIAIVAGVLLLAVALAPAAHLLEDKPARSAIGSHSTCAGHERWAIKALTDQGTPSAPGASAVDFAHPVKTTIDALRGNDTRPAKVSAKVARIKPLEFTVFSVRAFLQVAKGESDGDIHLVIHDEHVLPDGEPAHTMIVEFPDTRCEPQKSSAKASSMARAKRSFIDLVTKCRGATPTFKSWTQLTGKATIKGVGFWDIKHSNKGDDILDSPSVT